MSMGATNMIAAQKTRPAMSFVLCLEKKKNARPTIP